MTRLWTPQLRKEFHEAVEKLYATARNSPKEINYRDSPREAPSSRHTLQLRDELQLADHVAFLAHAEEGAHAISAACVEENENGLIVRLASNRTPSDLTISGLTKILDTFSEGARRGRLFLSLLENENILTSTRSSLGTRGDVLQDLLFKDVVDLSKKRILQRVRPPWMATPPYFRGTEKPLWERIDQVLNQAKFLRHSTTYGDIISRLDVFVSTARALRHKPDETQLRVAISSIVRSCAEVSYSGDYKSLEEQLKTLRHNLVTKDYIQIAKLARYFGLCRDLGKLAQRLSFRGTTKAITLERLIASEAEKPAGALKPCYVHAEVQLLLYYEQYPSNKLPRVIGCSKSACFLCDMLIKRLGNYQISCSHGRLYNRWTITDVSWMSVERALYFRDLLQTMTTEISFLARKSAVTDSGLLRNRRFGLESRAVLPLSSNSSLEFPRKSAEPRTDNFTPQISISTTTEPKPTPDQLKTALDSQTEEVAATGFATMHPAATVSCLNLPAALDLRKKDLPHHQKLNSKAETCLDLDRLIVMFDCSSISTGSLSIQQIEVNKSGNNENEVKNIRVNEIPDTEMCIGSVRSSKLKFRLQTQGSEALEIEIVSN